jgi:UDP-N-acetylmuramoyl-L-alanyl-D-glutamate--2,6-diaminopimelate ligase
VQITELIHDIDVIGARGDLATTEVLGVDFDSRRVRPGSLFCCVPGQRTNGHRYAAEAVDRGASSLLCEEFIDLDVTQLLVAPGTVRPAMASVASAFFGHPSRSLATVGVTGTNGKTTVTQLVRSILHHAGIPAGVIGTLHGERTTPEAPDLQKLLASLRDDGHRAVAVEVSSHALSQHRVDGIVFDVAAFTNLSRDHLDHHRTMEEYFAAKSRLFEAGRSKTAVINVDDAWGLRLADTLTGRPVVRVQRGDADDIDLAVGRSTFRWRGRPVALALSGVFNVDNALLAAAVASTMGVDDEAVVEGLSGARPVPGRMELVAPGSPVAVLVDYAHTPAGLEVALSSARGLTGSGRVVCVFGCGGDRDQGKRAQMGEVAGRLADVVLLTSDNPRSEDPAAIIEQIRSGVAAGVEPEVVPDRAQAIRAAISLASPGDIVVVAGKGHETTQVWNGRTEPFDDRVEAARALAERFGGGR